MADVNAQINIDINTAKAQSQLAALQQQIATLNKSMMSQQGKNGMLFPANATGQLKGVRGEIVKVQTASQLLNKTLAGSGVPKFGKAMENFWQTARKGSAATELAARNVATLNSQYKLLGTSATGTATAITTTARNYIGQRSASKNLRADGENGYWPTASLQAAEPTPARENRRNVRSNPRAHRT